MKKIRLRITDGIGNVSYLYRHTDGSWHLASKGAIPYSLSMISDDAMALRFALEDAGDDVEALIAAVKEHGGQHSTKVVEAV